jgi:SHS2 domain-containing protein
MPWRHLEGRTVADIAFEATGATLEEMLAAAVDALTGSMVTDLASVRPFETRGVALHAESVEMLLFDLLQEVIFAKDAHGLLLRAGALRVTDAPAGLTLDGELRGERIDRARHETTADVKAVTLSGYSVRRSGEGWRAEVVVDV